jgi:hypothetical protein
MCQKLILKNAKAPITMQIASSGVTRIRLWRKMTPRTHISLPTHPPHVDFQFVWENDAAHVQPLALQTDRIFRRGARTSRGSLLPRVFAPSPPPKWH